jgi:hypothetical protein
VLLAAKESERAGRGRSFLRAVNMSALGRFDLPGEFVQPETRRR